MNETEKKQKLVDYINSMGVDEKIALHNAYCDAVNCSESSIYAMDDMQEVLYVVDTWKLPIFAEDIADYILSEEDSLGNDEIQYRLDREINF